MLRNRPLIALIAAEVISSLGTLMATVALPWFVLETTGSTARMGLVLAAEAAPLVLLGIPSARLVARLGARRALLVCDALWIPATLLIPLLHWAGALSFGVLLALAFAAGVPWAAHFGSQQAAVPELLGEDLGRVARANAVLQTLSRLTYFVGPALGGVLIATFGAPTVLVVDAVSFAVSLAIVALLVPPTRPLEPELGGEAVAGGWRFVRSDAWMRPVTVAQALSQGTFAAMLPAIQVLAYEGYDRNARLAGALMAAWGGGAMAGSVLAYRLVASCEPRQLGAAAWALQALPLWLLAIERSPAVALTALGLSGLANGVRVPPIAGLTAGRIPARIRAETLTVAGALVLGAGFFCVLAAGPALAALSIGTVWAAIAAVQTAAALLFARAALREPS